MPRYTVRDKHSLFWLEAEDLVQAQARVECIFAGAVGFITAETNQPLYSILARPNYLGKITVPPRTEVPELI